MDDALLHNHAVADTAEADVPGDADRMQAADTCLEHVTIRAEKLGSHYVCCCGAGGPVLGPGAIG